MKTPFLQLALLGAGIDVAIRAACTGLPPLTTGSAASVPAGFYCGCITMGGFCAAAILITAVRQRHDGKAATWLRPFTAGTTMGLIIIVCSVVFRFTCAVAAFAGQEPGGVPVAHRYRSPLITGLNWLDITLLAPVRYGLSVSSAHELMFLLPVLACFCAVYT